MDPSNFQTLIELLLTHLANYEKNGHKIDNLLEREFVNTKWTEHNRGSLYFIKGVYEFLRGNTDNSLQNWLFAVEELNYPVEKFKKLEYYQARYGWPKELISLNLIYSKLSANPEKLPLTQRLTLHTILIVIGDQMAEDRQRQTQTMLGESGTRGGGDKARGHYSRGLLRGVDFRGGFNVGPYGRQKRPDGPPSLHGGHSRGGNGDGDTKWPGSA